MKTIGIISEYNPFHNGHRYHIEAARQEFGADHIVCIMSGNFVQRGEPAMLDKWSRAEMALLNGADLVLELPFVYSCQPADIFAFGAVNILNNLGSVDGICFGSELGSTEGLWKVAELLLAEPGDFSRLVKQHLSSGNTYPRSVSLALASYYGGHASILPEIWENPNNVLGIEYIKAILKLNSPLQAYTIKRVSNHYNDTEITQPIASATAVRKELHDSGISQKLLTTMPSDAAAILERELAAGRGPIGLKSFENILIYRLRTMSPEAIKSYISISEGLEHRIKKSAASACGMDELIEGIKTKRYTRAFIQRILCHILLDLKWEKSLDFKKAGTPSYTRVLGFNDRGKLLLRKFINTSPYPVINKVASFKTGDPVLEEMFQYDLRATDVYNLVRPNTLCRKGGEDFLTSPRYVK
jgi:predicted nucleotidyltransferase